MSHYVTKIEDNVEEVVSLHLSEDVSAIAKDTISKYGEIEFNRNKNGTYEGELVKDRNVKFRIVKG